MIRESRNPKDVRDHTSLWKIGNGQTKPGRKTRTRIQEMAVEKDNEAEGELGKDEDSG